MGPRKPFIGTGIVREMSTRYVLFIKVVSSFFLMVKTLILLGFVTVGLDSGFDVWALECFLSFLTEETFDFPFKSVEDFAF